VAILGICAAGVGITLTAASTVVFAELHWTPGVILQAEDRVHRIGQKCSVNVHFLLANGTVDDFIWPSIVHKVEVVSAMCDGRKNQLIANRVSASHAARDAGDTAFTDMDGAVDDFISTCTIPQTRSELPTASTSLVGGSSTRPPIQSPPPAESCVSTSTERRAAADLIESVSDVEPEQPKMPSCSFCVSHKTLRLHVLNMNGQPLGVNVKIADWEVMKDRSSFPSALLNDGEVVKEVERFLWEWISLKSTDHRHLMDDIIHLPLSKFLPQKKNPTKVNKKRDGPKSQALHC